MEPYVINSYDEFIVVYKPPYYIMDTSTDYTKKQKKKLKNN